MACIIISLSENKWNQNGWPICCLQRSNEQEQNKEYELLLYTISIILYYTYEALSVSPTVNPRKPCNHPQNKNFQGQQQYRVVLINQ